MGANSKDTRHLDIAALLDRAAVLSRLAERCQVIIDHAHHHSHRNPEPSFDSIYFEAQQMRLELLGLIEGLAELSNEIEATIEADYAPALPFKKAG